MLEEIAAFEGAVSATFDKAFFAHFSAPDFDFPSAADSGFRETGPRAAETLVRVSSAQCGVVALDFLRTQSGSDAVKAPIGHQHSTAPLARMRDVKRRIRCGGWRYLECGMPAVPFKRIRLSYRTRERARSRLENARGSTTAE